MRITTKNKLAKGTLILTLSSFVVKILSAIYRVPFQNLVGNEGFYVYQQVYPIYGIAMTFALAGVPVFLSKLVMEQQDEEEKKKIVGEIFPLLFWLSMSLFAVTFFGSHWLATWMGDQQLSGLIQMTSFVFLLTPVLAVFRGYFQGNLWMVPTAISQVVEQLIRVGTIIFAAFCFTRTDWSIYKMGTIAMSGAIFGGIAAYFVLVYYNKKTTIKLLFSFQMLTKWRKSLTFFKRFTVEGGLICIYSAFLVLFQLIDSFVVKNMLVLHGFSQTQAKIEKGIYDRGQPLVQLGLVLAAAMTSVYLPVLTKYIVEKNQKQYLTSVKTYLRITWLVTSAASIGLVLLLPYVNRSLFGDTAGNQTLEIFVLAIFLMSMIQGYQTVLQSDNQLKIALVAAGMGLLIKGILAVPLTRSYGTTGASFSTLVGLVGSALVLHIYLERKNTFILFSRSFILKTGMALVGMSLTLLIYRSCVQYFLGMPISRVLTLVIAVFGVILGIGVYGISILRLNILTKKEWQEIPYGEKLRKIKRKKRGE